MLFDAFANFSKALEWLGGGAADIPYLLIWIPNFNFDH